MRATHASRRSSADIWSSAIRAFSMRSRSRGAWQATDDCHMAGQEQRREGTINLFQSGSILLSCCASARENSTARSLTPLKIPGFPAPIVAETRAMPSHQRLGPDGRHRLHDRWKPPIQLEEEQAIAVREAHPTTHLALKHDQLMSKRGILSLEPADRPERRNQQPQKEDEQRDHRGRRYVIPSSDQTDEVFGTHTAYFWLRQSRPFCWLKWA